MTTTLVITPMISATCCLHGVPPTRKLVFRSWLVVPALLAAMHTTVPIDSAAAVYACPVRPSATKIRHTPISVAMAMPLIGLDEEPSSPVMRDETTEKKNPKTMMDTAEIRAGPIPGTVRSCGRNDMNTARATDPMRTTEIGMSRSVRRRSSAPPIPVSRRSRNDARKLSMIVGIALTRLMIPPAATAPAPM